MILETAGFDEAVCEWVVIRTAPCVVNYIDDSSDTPGDRCTNSPNDYCIDLCRYI